MREILSVSLCLAIALCLWGCGDGKKPPAPGGGPTGRANPDVPDKPPLDPPVNPGDDDLARMRRELDNTEWQVRLVPQSGKGKEKTDVLTFAHNKIKSERFADEEFPSSNYTLRIKVKGAEWETMQTNEKGGTVFWRIQLRDGKMRGIVVVKSKRRKDEVLSLVSTSSRKIQPPPLKEVKKKKAAAAPPTAMPKAAPPPKEEPDPGKSERPRQ